MLNNSTQEALRQSANALISESADIETAHKTFASKVASRFESNPEGLTPEAYKAEAETIWEDVALQRGAKPAQPGEQAGQRSGQ